METQEIGYISKTHGLKGHVILRLFDDIDIDEEAIASVFIDMNGSQVPYFIEECRHTNTGFILKLENLDGVDTAKKLIGKRVSALEEFVIADEDSLSEFVGYTIVDTELGDIGRISEVDDKTENVIVRVAHPSGKEIILPFNDDLIVEIDDEERSISFRAPAGLVDMYLNS